MIQIAGMSNLGTQIEYLKSYYPGVAILVLKCLGRNAEMKAYTYNCISIKGDKDFEDFTWYVHGNWLP